MEPSGKIRNVNLKIIRCGSCSPSNAEFGHFTLLFCRVWQRSVARIITHVHSHCIAHQHYCLATLLLPLQFSQTPNHIHGRL